MCMCVDIVVGVCAVRCSNIGQLLCSENYGIRTKEKKKKKKYYLM